MTTCYVDESGTDSNLPVAVVAGLVLDFEGTYWLSVEWSKFLAQHGVSGPIHMKEFGPDGRFKHVTHENRRALFSGLVRLINSNKLISLAATLTAEQYRRHFARVTKQSMYGACFTNLMTLVGVAMKIHGPHRWPLDYVLDDGNAYKKAHHRRLARSAKSISPGTFHSISI